eukprot:Skav220407  [mRNA]  locus=scaffold639:441151:443686:- [translate_table: standard]
MDKRLPHRIREIRLQFQSAGKSCTADGRLACVKDELCKTYSEYGRLKQQALRRMVLQELSTPLPADPSKEANGDGQTDGQVSAEPKKKKRRKAETNEKSEGKDSAFPPQATAEKENMNDSIRRLYSQSVPDSLGARAERLGQDATSVRKAKEKAAMAAARREQGLSDPKSSGFAPEDRPEERLEDLGGKILEKMVQGMRLAESLDLKFLAKKTAGFVGADLSALTKEAALGAVQRAFTDLSASRAEKGGGCDGLETAYSTEEMAKLAIEASDFTEALSKVQPSARREGFTTIPDVKWEDVGALKEVRWKGEIVSVVCQELL